MESLKQAADSTEKEERQKSRNEPRAKHKEQTSKTKFIKQTISNMSRREKQRSKTRRNQEDVVSYLSNRQSRESTGQRAPRTKEGKKGRKQRQKTAMKSTTLIHELSKHVLKKNQPEAVENNLKQALFCEDSQSSSTKREKNGQERNRSSGWYCNVRGNHQSAQEASRRVCQLLTFCLFSVLSISLLFAALSRSAPLVQSKKFGNLPRNSWRSFCARVLILLSVLPCFSLPLIQSSDKMILALFVPIVHSSFCASLFLSFHSYFGSFLFLF